MNDYPIATEALRGWIVQHRIAVLRMLGAEETKASEVDFSDPDCVRKRDVRVFMVTIPETEIGQESEQMNDDDGVFERAVCPECLAGKHGNCNGRAWDRLRDDETNCECEVCSGA